MPESKECDHDDWHTFYVSACGDEIVAHQGCKCGETREVTISEKPE